MQPVTLEPPVAGMAGYSSSARAQQGLVRHDHMLLVLIFGSMMLYTFTALSIIPGDLIVVGYVGFLVLVSPTFVPSLSTLRPLAVPVYFFTLAGFMALAGDDGLTRWAVIAVARDAMAMLWFIAGFAYGRMTNWSREQLANVLVFFMTLEMGILAATFVGYRSGGTFPNPNYAAHFTMVLAVASFVLSDRRWIRVLAVVCGLGGVVATGSFGLVVGMLSAVLFGSAYAQKGVSWSTRFVKLGLLALAAFAIFLVIRQNPSATEFDFSESLNTKRLNRSGGTRFEIWGAAIDAWKQDLLGLGPEGVNAKDALAVVGGKGETHSDVVTTLTERGVLGIVALAAMPFAIMRSSKNRFSLPILLVAILVASIFRDTLHYRHSAVVLGILVATPHVSKRVSAATGSSGADTEVPQLA